MTKERLSGDDAVMFIHQYRIGEAKLFDAFGNLVNLFGGMFAGVASIEFEIRRLLTNDFVGKPLGQMVHVNLHC